MSRFRRWFAIASEAASTPALGADVERLDDRALLSATPIEPAAARLSELEITTTASDAPIFRQGWEKPGNPVLGQTPQSTPLINLDDFRADSRFAGIDGSGGSIVILDTGIDLNHPAFGPDANNDGVSDRIVYQYDYVNNDNNASDGNGHGSNVASIAASSFSSYVGMAPAANVIALKVLSDSGSGSFSYVESALQWVAANAATYNIVSVNMSLGDGGNSNTAAGLYGVGDELQALANLGVIVVSAAGNDYYSYQTQGHSYPASDPNSFSVGAVWDGNNGSVSWASGARDYTTGADRLTSFSQRSSSQVDFFAPGAFITGANQSGGSVSYGGTSQASPHIAGIASLAQELAQQTLGRKLTPTEFRNVVRNSANSVFDGDDEDDNVTNTQVSYRRVNVQTMGEAILAMASPPEIQILDGATDLVSGSGVIDFGTTLFGASVDKTFTINNTGTSALSLSSPAFTGPFSLVGAFPTSIDAGGTATFTVRMTAATLGARAGTASIVNNDLDESPFSLSFSGNVVAPEIAVSDGSNNIPDGGSTVGFGSATVGVPVEKTFTITNSGSSVLTLSGLTLPAGFSLVGSLPSSIATGGSSTLTVRLDAASVGVFSGALSFVTNDADENPFNFTLTGTVAATTLLPTVVTTSFAGTGTVAVNATSLTVRFSETVTGAAVAGNYALQRAGTDGNLGTDDDLTVPITSATVSGCTATLNFAALSSDLYRLTVMDAIADTAGQFLDGDQNGIIGGNHVRSFAVGSPSKIAIWGLSTELETNPSPIFPIQDNDFVSITGVGGNQFAVGLKADGTVWAWGDNVYGQLLSHRLL